MSASLPSRQDVQRVLEDLLARRISREQASDWSRQFVDTDWDPYACDYPVFVALEALSGVDTRELSQEYVHSDENIRDWLRTLHETPVLNAETYDEWIKTHEKESP